MKDYYEILEVSRHASKETINKVFKMHMKASHPDLFQGEEKTKAEERSKELTEAYNILSDDFQRQKYDEELKDSESSSDQVQAILEENEYLRQALAQKDSYIAQLTNNFNATQQAYGYAPPPPQGGYGYQQGYNTGYNQGYNQGYQGGYQQEDQNNPYAGMTLEQLQQLKKEQTKIYYKAKFKEMSSTLIVMGLLLAVLLISLRSSLSQVSSLFGGKDDSNKKDPKSPKTQIETTIDYYEYFKI